MTFLSNSLPCLLVIVIVLVSQLNVEAFAPVAATAASAVATTSAVAGTHLLPTTAPLLFPDASVLLAAATLDPTTVLSDLFAGLIGSPLILAVPIVLALGVATTIAWLIVAYASPAESDD